MSVIRAQKSTSFTFTTFIATAGQTVLTINYTPGLVEVFKNGFFLTPITDYAASNGTTIVLVSPALLNDEFVVRVFTYVSSSNALTSNAIGTTVQPNLVSGSNIKTINSTSVLGSGDIPVQAVLVSGTSIKTIDSVSLLGSGDIAVKDKTAQTGLLKGNGTAISPVVSGTDIKTINNTSLLGSGDIDFKTIDSREPTGTGDIPTGFHLINLALGVI